MRRPRSAGSDTGHPSYSSTGCTCHSRTRHSGSPGRWSTRERRTTSRPNGLGPASSNSQYLHLDYKRNVKSAYAELFIPVIGPDMHFPAAYSFDLNLAGRYDKYSDFGSTKNPKIGANWEVIRGIRLRGNWARSSDALQRWRLRRIA